MKIGELARRAGVATSTVRYYERIGLLPQAPRIGGQRQYDQQMLAQLTVIELGQRAGFSLEEIATLLRGMRPGGSLSGAWKSMANRKLEELEALAAQIETMRQLLTEGLRCGCLSLSDCSLVPRIEQERSKGEVRKPKGVMLRRKGKGGDAASAPTASLLPSGDLSVSD